MRYPPRLGHLATRPLLVSRLLPLYARAHQVEEEVARPRLEAALQGPLREALLAATWEALRGQKKRLDEAGLLQKVADCLAERPFRPGRKVEPTPGWSAFLLQVDLAAGTLSESARRVLESEEGRRRATAGLAEVGAWLAQELVRSR